MYQGPSLEANTHSASQETTCLLMEPVGSLPCSQEPTSGPYPQSYASISHIPTLIL